MKYLYNISRIHNCWNRFRIKYMVWDITKLPTILRNYPREKILNPRNTHDEKSWTHEIQPRKNRGHTKASKKLGTTKYTHEKIFWTHEIPTRKSFEPTKYPRRHHGTRPTRPTMARDPRNLAHSNFSISIIPQISRTNIWYYR